MQPKPGGARGDSDAADVLADIRSLLMERYNDPAPEEPELLLVHPKASHKVRAEVSPKVRPELLRRPPPPEELEMSARSRARIERALGGAKPIETAPLEPAPLEPPQPQSVKPDVDPVEPSRQTFSTGPKRLRSQPIPPHQADEAVAEVVADTSVEVAPIEPIADIEVLLVPATPVEDRPAEVEPSPENVLRAALRDTVRGRLDSGPVQGPWRSPSPAPTPTPKSRAEAKREPRLTDSLAAGLKQANLEIEELIAANRSAYAYIFGEAELPARSNDCANPSGTTANGQLVGSLSELQRAVDELGSLLGMFLPRI